MWTRNITKLPSFSYEHLEQHLVTGSNSVENRPTGASRHKKTGYKLFKCGYVSSVLVKPDVDMGKDVSLFLVNACVRADEKRRVCRLCTSNR